MKTLLLLVALTTPALAYQTTEIDNGTFISQGINRGETAYPTENSPELNVQWSSSAKQMGAYFWFTETCSFSGEQLEIFKVNGQAISFAKLCRNGEILRVAKTLEGNSYILNKLRELENDRVKFDTRRKQLAKQDEVPFVSPFDERLGGYGKWVADLTLDKWSFSSEGINRFLDDPTNKPL